MGADVNASSSKLKQTPLHLASAKGLVLVLVALLDAGADYNAVDNAGLHAIHLAAKHDALSVCHFLIESVKVPVDVRDAEGHTPLMWAAYAGHARILRHLISFSCLSLFFVSLLNVSEPLFAARLFEALSYRPSHCLLSPLFS